MFLKLLYITNKTFSTSHKRATSKNDFKTTVVYFIFK